MSRPIDVTSAGAVSVQRAQAFMTSLARSKGKNSAPAYTSRIGNRANSIAVTTAKLPPPPRSAQNRSGSYSASTRRISPSAVTTSNARTWLSANPWDRASQLTPPPSV